MDSSIEQSRRLQEHYRSLTDGEMQSIAGDAYELTDAASEALDSEILRRGLDIKLVAAPTPAVESEEPQGDLDPAELDLTPVGRAADADEARRLISILNGAGIPCYLGTENAENVDAFHAGFDAGVDLKVRDVDLQRAQRALFLASPAETEAEPDGLVARCPNCNSPDIVFLDLDEPGSAASKFNWSCDACGHKWTDDGIEKEA